jgi:TonB family protein
MSWLPKVAMTFYIGIAAAQQAPVIVDPEDELLSMLREWRQPNQGNTLSHDPDPAGAAAGDASANPGSCLVNGKPNIPCPYVGNTGGRDQRTPVVLSAIQPEYPTLAAASGIRGRVSLVVTIDENGIPQDSKVISVSATDPGGQVIKEAKTFGFDQAALLAVRNWIFAPGTKDGAPTSKKLIIEVNFPPQN